MSQSRVAKDRVDPMRNYAVVICGLILSSIFPHASPTIPKPKIYVYDLPDELRAKADNLSGGDKERALAERVKNDPEFYTADAATADYYWIPGQGHVFVDYIKSKFPYWNQTVAAKQARHIMVTLHDGGPGEVFAEHNLGTNPTQVKFFPPDMDPESSERNIIFLMWNGRRDIYPKEDHKDYRCGVCFHVGLDIQIPTMENVCGPLCSGISIHELRNSSVWYGNRSNDFATKPRRHRMFFVGTSPSYKADGTGRGTFFVNHYNDSRYVVAGRGHPHHHPDLYTKRVTTSMAMPHSDFSFSPLGVNGGDSDRYVPAVLYGSVPVLLNSSVLGHQPRTGVPQALPLEEVIDWSSFSTLVDEHSLDSLDKHLDCLTPKLPMMRQAMKNVWENLLWTSIYSGIYKNPKSSYPSVHNTRDSYLGESGKNDAFEKLMQVLGSRIPQGYKPTAETMERMKHKGWPCREEVDKIAEGIAWRV